MARFTVGHGIDNYIADLEKLLVDEEEIIGRSIFEGAKIVTDAVRSEIEGIPTREYDASSDTISGITDKQKAGLQEGLGIASMRRDGSFINVKVGMDGYNSIRTRKYPKGQPNALIARALCTGTSFRVRNDFIGRAVRSTRSAAEAAMKKQCDEEIKKRIH
jgi:hypothetical protein